MGNYLLRAQIHSNKGKGNTTEKGFQSDRVPVISWERLHIHTNSGVSHVDHSGTWGHMSTCWNAAHSDANFALNCAVCVLSHVRLFVTPWTVVCQVPLSMGFSRQDYWSGLPCPPPEDLPDPGIEPTSLVSSALVGGFFTTVSPGKPLP